MRRASLISRGRVRLRRDLELARYGLLRPRMSREERRIAQRPRSGPLRVGVVHFWDTRESLRAAWENNGRIVEHNLRTIEEGLDGGLSLEHHLIIHEVGQLPSVSALARRLVNERGFNLEPVQLDLTGIGDSHKLNYVAAEAFRRLSRPLRACDYILILCQDMILINHLPMNAIEVMVDLASRGGDAGFGHLRYGDPLPYVCQTAGVDPLTPSFRIHYAHNAVIGGGFFPASKLPYLELAAERSGDWIPAESYLGVVLGQKCTYLRPDPKFYFGTYGMKVRTPQETDDLLALTRRENADRVVRLAQMDWGGGLRTPYLEG